MSNFVTIRSFQRTDIVSVPRSDNKKKKNVEAKVAPNTVLDFFRGLEINGDFLEIEIKSPLNVRIGSRKSFKSTVHSNIQ